MILQIGDIITCYAGTHVGEDAKILYFQDNGTVVYELINGAEDGEIYCMPISDIEE